MVEEKAMGGLAPTFVTLGTSCHLRMNKDQFFVCVWGLMVIRVFGCVFFNVNLVKTIDR